MARPKPADMRELAERAQRDLDAIDGKRLAVKLKSIRAAASSPVALVADVMEVTVQSILRWIAEYRGGGLDALRPAPKAPRRSKLGDAQKEAVLSWLRSCRTARGEETRWTLDGLRAAIAEEFGVTLARNTIWVWIRKEGQRQMVPRPRHHQADTAAQEDFKKKRRS